MKPGTIVICLASKVWVPLPIRPLMSSVLPDGHELTGFHGERLGLRHAGIHRVDFGIKHDQIGDVAFGSRCLA